MKKKVYLSALCLAVCLFFAANISASEVIQGKCLVYDTGAKTIKLEEFDTNFSTDAPYGQPTGIISDVDCSQAKIGIFPEPGDILRIAYRIKGEVKEALKVMNVSKQDLRKK